MLLCVVFVFTKMFICIFTFSVLKDFEVNPNI